MNLEEKPNRLWPAVLERVELLLAEGHVMSSRSAGYRRDIGGGREAWMCVLKVYPFGLETIDYDRRWVYHIEAYDQWSNREKRSSIKIKVEGPFEDHGDAYWTEMRQRDVKECDWIVTPDYEHYTISPNSRTPGWGDGHGGALFVFEFNPPGGHVPFSEKGLKVLLADQESGDGAFFKNESELPRLYSRNVWSQGTIPKKHRHMWTPNAQVVQDEKILQLGS